MKKVMTMCLGRGVWELLWNREDGAGGGDVENGENSRNSVGEQDEEEKEEEEDRSEAERVLSVRGWELLDWLVQLWEDDQATSTSGLGEGMSFFPKNLNAKLIRPDSFLESSSIFPHAALPITSKSILVSHRGHFTPGQRFCPHVDHSERLQRFDTR